MNLISNMAFSESFKSPLTKVRRWTKEFLPPDMAAKRQAGIARMMTPNQAFRVFLGGHLVEVLGFKFSEARKILDGLQPWMNRLALWPDLPTEAQLSPTDKLIKNFSVRIFQVEKGDFYLRAIGKIRERKVETGKDGDRSLWGFERYTEYSISKPERAFLDLDPILLRSKILEIDHLLHNFIFYIDTHGEERIGEWVKRRGLLKGE